jgi:osmoprotectant transport system ATP-binding protein
MQDMLKELLKRVGKTTLIVTHDLQEALYLADRVVFVDGGKIVADLAREDVMKSEQEAVQRYVAVTTRGGAA